MSNQKLRIAITGPSNGGTTAWLFTALNIRLQGAQPIRVQPSTFDGNMDYDAIIIGGGSDIHPNNFDEAATKPVERSLRLKIKESILYPMELLAKLSGSPYDKERDELEKKFIAHAIENDIPLLGICRGHQLINAFLGGTMYTSTLPLLEDSPRIRSPFPRKEVLVTKKGSLINEIVDDNPLMVNAIHSQAVAKPAPSLQVTAKEKAGIAQVIEPRDDHRILGVQWHPEYLFYMQAHRNIFAWLVQEAA